MLRNLSIVFLSLFYCGQVCCITNTWTGGGFDSLWRNPDNWTNGIPDENFDALIPGGFEVKATGIIEVKSLVIIGSVLRTNASISFIDTFYIASDAVVYWETLPWVSGVIINHGEIFHDGIIANSTLFTNAILHNFNRFTHQDGVLGISGQFINESSGMLDLKGSNTNVGGVTNGISMLTNYGIIRKSAIDLDIPMSVLFLNEGTMMVDQGTLTIKNFNSILGNGFYETGPGANIVVERGKLRDTLSGEADITLRIIGLADSTWLDISNPGITWTFNKIVDTFPIFNLGRFRADYDFNLTLDLPVFENHGEFIFSSSNIFGTLNIQKDFINKQGATFEISDIGRVIGEGTLINKGLIKKTNLTSASIEVGLIQQGEIQVGEGTLIIKDP